MLNRYFNNYVTYNGQYGLPSKLLKVLFALGPFSRNTLVEILLLILKMADRRRWTLVETNKLVELMQENYQFLFEALNNSKTKRMVDDRWTEVTAQINAIGSGKTVLTAEKVQRKWTDLKSTTKLHVMKYRKGQKRTGGGTNPEKEPTELQWKIHTMIGSSATSGIAGAESCDSSSPVEVPATANSQTALATIGSTSEVSTMNAASLATANISAPQPSPCSSTSGRPSPHLNENRPSPYLLKRPQKTPKQQQLEQNKELLKTEGELLDAVAGIRDEMQQMNSTLNGMYFEFKRFVEVFAQGQGDNQQKNNQLSLYYNS